MWLAAILIFFNGSKLENGTQEKFHCLPQGLRGSKPHCWQSAGSRTCLIEVNRPRNCARYSSMAQRHAAELQEIDAALARIADGSYGDCEECGGNIGAPRLEAQPTARLCIACQEQLEQRPDAPPRPTM
jgi:hypothetical protein